MILFCCFLEWCSIVLDDDVVSRTYRHVLKDGTMTMNMRILLTIVNDLPHVVPKKTLKYKNKASSEQTEEDARGRYTKNQGCISPSGSSSTSWKWSSVITQLWLLDCISIFLVRRIAESPNVYCCMWEYYSWERRISWVVLSAFIRNINQYLERNPFT